MVGMKDNCKEGISTNWECVLSMCPAGCKIFRSTVITIYRYEW